VPADAGQSQAGAPRQLAVRREGKRGEREFSPAATSTSILIFLSLFFSYDGYRLTPLGADYLALRALVAGGHLAAVGPQIGVGKEADVFAGATPDGTPAAIKFHRLGRTSFRAGVRAKRDYATPKGRVAHSWLHLSRLAATKEAAFMGALHGAGFAVPALLAANRHAVLMSRVVGMPLYRAVRSAEGLKHPMRVYAQAMAFVEGLAARGLVHCDLNEFNLMVRRNGDRIREMRRLYP
jgi:RIO kinase 2